MSRIFFQIRYHIDIPVRKLFPVGAMTQKQWFWNNDFPGANYTGAAGCLSERSIRSRKNS